ncbi:hypothetical protein [Paenibacillus sp. ACRRY]|uniref:hypothetical protein n=1 Tax=Paenibacillus sp. ACRRY TaxID=2918208 RepID=UPI001EF54CB4|nr:hypothetical protein [Paenibacillus sp. ACRRY]MCG7381935.1 hypothetical protein [Paenibacillus sp. ACRRY]
MRLTIYILLFLLVLTGCSGESEDTIIPDKKISNSLTLTPVDLTKGEAAKLKPFLGTMSGAFKLKYEGEKPRANLDMDIWKNGEKVDFAGSIGDLFFSPEGQMENSTEIEVIISIDTVRIEEQKETCIVKISTGSGLATFTLPWNPELKGRGLIQHTETLTYTTDRPIPTFAMHATSSNQVFAGDFTEEALSKTDWALVFTVRFDE